MSKLPSIEVKGIAKAYNITSEVGAITNTHPTVKDDLIRIAKKPLQLMGSTHAQQKEKFWALQDINFEVLPGEVVGVMGKNGSGKSTLFKILSRITQPTKGEAILRGKTASLLEVGTGFHPELSGRENVYLNGSILGMKKVDIERQFDDIVEFSEIKKFIDTPVKFYSSGMRVRLAFAVAVHLNADILIIDEVLAVGDLRFKQKSIEKMREIAASGKTIMFVSHIVRHFQRICTKGIVLEDGQIVHNGDLDEAIELYLDSLHLDEAGRTEAAEEDGADTSFTKSSAEIKLLYYKVDKSDSMPSAKLHIEVTNNTDQLLSDVRLVCRVDNMNNNMVVVMTNDNIGRQLSIEANETKTITLDIKQLPLLPGKYFLSLVLKDVDPGGVTYASKQNVSKLEVPNYDNPFVKLGDPAAQNNGVLLDYDYVVGDTKISKSHSS